MHPRKRRHPPRSQAGEPAHRQTGQHQDRRLWLLLRSPVRTADHVQEWLFIHRDGDALLYGARGVEKRRSFFGFVTLSCAGKVRFCCRLVGTGMYRVGFGERS